MAVAGLVASCAGAGPHTLSWPADRTIAVAHGDRIRNWPQAISSVVEVLQGPLGLPPVEFSVSFYPSRGAFERGLIDSGYPPGIARRTAATLDGVGMPGRVLLYEGAVARTTWRARVAMLAHEIVHVLQYDLAAVLDYFRRFAVSDDEEGNFAAAFDESKAEREAAFRAHLAGR